MAEDKKRFKPGDIVLFDTGINNGTIGSACRFRKMIYSIECNKNRISFCDCT